MPLGGENPKGLDTDERSILLLLKELSPWPDRFDGSLVKCRRLIGPSGVEPFLLFADQMKDNPPQEWGRDPRLQSKLVIDII